MIDNLSFFYKFIIYYNMKKIINYSIIIALIVGILFGLLYPVNLSEYVVFINIISFKIILILLLISLLCIVLPLISLNLSQTLLFFEGFSFGYMISLFIISYKLKGLLFIIVYFIFFKLLNIFILYLNSFYSYKFIKHIYLNIFNKYKRNINNLFLYMKKIIVMSSVYFINNIICLILKYFFALKLFKFIIDK